MIEVFLPRILASRVGFAVLRFVAYGTIGLAAEVFFYNLTRWGRRSPLTAWAFAFDWRVDPSLGLGGVWEAAPVALFGQVSLWMFLVYALCSLFLIEPMYRRMARAPWLVRGLAYALVILGYEWAVGLLLKALTGVYIWIYVDPWALGPTTSLALVPSWIGTGLFAEALYRGLRLLAPATSSRGAARP